MPAWLAPASALVAVLALGGCGGDNPLMTPVGWWHDLAGGEIAADRPPPPGADLPYPHIYSIPPKPVLPSDAFRRSVETQLSLERDDTQRLAARNPIVVESVPPPPVAAPPPAAGADPGDEPSTANATLPGADAPPLKPSADAPAAKPALAAADGGPAPGAPLIITGLPADEANLPNVPDAPPPPATFEGVAALPAPSRPPPLPAHVPLGGQGTAVYFAPGSAVLDASQTQTIKEAAFHLGHGAIEVEGHGQAVSDAPEGQEAALALALKRAEAVAVALEKQRVSPAAIRISATAFGLGASLRPAS